MRVVLVFGNSRDAQADSTAKAAMLAAVQSNVRPNGTVHAGCVSRHLVPGWYEPSRWDEESVNYYAQA